MTFVKRSYLNYFIDVSGVCGNKTYFGLVGIKNTDINKTMKEFKREFPLALNKKAKAVKSNEKDLMKIMDFLDKRVVMNLLFFNNDDWRYYKKRFSDLKKHFYSRLYGILYLKLLKANSFRGHSYLVVLCSESYLSSPRSARTTCLDLAKYDKYSFYLAHGDHRTYMPLKLADYVAGAGRRLDKKTLSRYDNLNFISKKIPKIYLMRTFGKYVK